jgi:hypothetical protein
MKYFIFFIKLFLVFSFLCHSYIVMTPAIDEMGFFGVAVHVLLSGLSWLLFNLSTEIQTRDQDEK